MSKPECIRPLRESALVGGFTTLLAIAGIAGDFTLDYDAMLRETREGLLRTAQAVAAGIDGDAHASLVDRAQEDGATYRREVARLRRFAADSHPAVAYVYTLRLVDGKARFVLDAAAVGDKDGDGVEDHSFLMDEYDDVSPAALEALRTASPRLVDEPVTDKWGTFLSAYAPILAAGDRCDGVVGVDMALATLLQSRGRLLFRSFLFGLAAVAFAGGLGLALYRSRSRLRLQLEQQRQAAELLTRQQVAEAASEAKSRFLAHMSHEIRTPLGIVTGNAELLLDEAPVDRTAREHAEAIYRSSKHLLVLLNEVLDLAKIESGRLQVERIPTRLPELLTEVRDMFALTARECGLSLDLEAPTELPTVVRSDPLRIRQVLVNLVGNAIKFTTRGGVRMVVTVDRKAGRVEVQVSDTGPGMTRAQLDALFQPFEQTDASVARRHGGTGLGLNISRELCVLLGGDLRVTAEPGRGSTFVASFDTGDLAGVEFGPLRAADDSVPTGTDAVRLAGRRVLLADDGADNRRLYGAILSRSGAIVTERSDGAQAVAAATDPTATWDLIVLDVQMPELDGPAAAARIRAAGVTAPILALTAAATAADEERCRAHGCDGFAPKPIARRRLLAECERLIGRRRS